MAPWKIALETDEEKRLLESILYRLIRDLRQVALMLLPFFEVKMRELLDRIGNPYDDTLTLTDHLLAQPQSYIVREKGEPLYMRITPTPSL